MTKEEVLSKRRQNTSTSISGEMNASYSLILLEK